MKYVCSILLFFALSFAYVNISTPIFAAKKFVPKKSTRKTVSSGSVPSIVQYRPDKKGLYLSFSNFNGIESVAYTFTYTANGIAQGAGGTISSSNNPTSRRELLFGTCSTSVCTYHSNITNARLVLVGKRANGTTATKAYRIKTYF